MVPTMKTEELAGIKEQYGENGYVLIRELFDAAELQIYSDRFEALVKGEVKAPSEMKIMRDIMVVKGLVEPRSTVHAINKLISFEDDSVLYGYVKNAALLKVVRVLLGDFLYSISTNIFNKPPDVDGRHPMHQDLRYFRIRPASGIVGVWTAMAPANRESGCLAIIPGSHKGALLDHGNPDWEHVNYAFYGAENVTFSNRQFIEMDVGDTLFFHPLLVHGSGQNRSNTFRRAISVHYAGDFCESPGRDWRIGKQARKLW